MLRIIKKLAALMALFIVFGIGAYSQQSYITSPEMDANSRITSIVKGAPFSAEAISESIQVLSDGNRIIRNSSNRLYRNSEGRFRRDVSGDTGGSLGSFYAVGPGITILDPVAGQRMLIDPKLKTARVGVLKVRTVSSRPAALSLIGEVTARQAETLARVRSESDKANSVAGMLLQKSGQAAKSEAEKEKVITGTGAKAPSARPTVVKHRPLAAVTSLPSNYLGTSPSSVFSPYFASGILTKMETRDEELGTQTIEGVLATGTRKTSTIPAGAIGNERPIEIVYERWYSDDLQLVVMSKHNDPRFGEQTYRLVNILRSEPENSVFELPAGFKVLPNPAAAYTITMKEPSSGALNKVSPASLPPVN